MIKAEIKKSILSAIPAVMLSARVRNTATMNWTKQPKKMFGSGRKLYPRIFIY